MAYATIRGFDGKVEEGASPTALLGVADWEITVTIGVETDGPFLNDSGKIYKSISSVDSKGKVKGSVSDGKDTALTSIKTAALAGTAINLVLTQGVQGGGTGGYVYTCATSVISDFKLTQAAKGGAKFEFSFEGSGTFTIA